MSAAAVHCDRERDYRPQEAFFRPRARLELFALEQYLFSMGKISGDRGLDLQGAQPANLWIWNRLGLVCTGGNLALWRRRKFTFTFNGFLLDVGFWETRRF